MLVKPRPRPRGHGASCLAVVAFCLTAILGGTAPAAAQPHSGWSIDDPAALAAPEAGVEAERKAAEDFTDFPQPSLELTEPALEVGPEDEARWREEWTHFRWWQYAMTGTLFVTTMVIETDTVIRLRDTDDLSGGILFDEPIQDVVGAPTQTTRKLAARVSDVFFHFNMAVPALIDPGVALLVHGDFELAWQIFWIGAQARVVTGFLTRITQVAIGRDRPYVRHCKSGEYLDDNCKTPGFYQSFFSGHTSLVFASAGATCSIHENIPLYGGGTADDLACGITIASGFLTGLFRLVSDRHWATDVILGGAVGFSVGYFLPEWLQFTSAEDDDSGVAVMPQAMGADGGGILVHGWM